MYLLRIPKKLSNSYVHDGYIEKVYWDNKTNIFLKMYKEYTGNTYPKFARTNTKNNIVTEKSIEEIKEELKVNLDILNRYTNDKRVSVLRGCIKNILLALDNNYIILNEISFDKINKEFMDGKVCKVDKLKSKFIPHQTLVEKLCEFVLTEYECMFVDD